MPLAQIESLDNEGRGIARVDGKTIFIEGALPGETVEYASFRRKPTFELATATQILRESSQRVVPACPHFGICGGCSMQHANTALQIAAKQRVLEDALWHIGRLRAEQILPPIAGLDWGYRHRARLSIRYVAKKNAMLVGFHEKKSSFVAVMDSCAILPPTVSALLKPLQTLMAAMSIRDRLPQLEVAVGSSEATEKVFVLRNMAPLSAEDEAQLRRFADEHRIVWYLQPKGPDTVARFHPPGEAKLHYALPDFDLTLDFAPTEFTQVNPHVNRALLRRAMALLQPAAGERIADLFCGLGNFSLPIAQCGAQVFGIEGSAPLIQRAKQNAQRNGLSARCDFAVANLFDEKEIATTFKANQFDKLLIDPPRDGAQTLVSALPESSGPHRIVYVSCNPATLARDAAILVSQKGYALRGAGIACMFPHTSHVESIALFERNAQ